MKIDLKRVSINRANEKTGLPKNIFRIIYNMKYNNLDKFYNEDKIDDVIYNGNNTEQFILANDFVSKLDDRNCEKLPYKKEEYVPYIVKLFKAV